MRLVPQSQASEGREVLFPSKDQPDSSRFPHSLRSQCRNFCLPPRPCSLDVIGDQTPSRAGPSFRFLSRFPRPLSLPPTRIVNFGAARPRQRRPGPRWRRKGNANILPIKSWIWKWLGGRGGLGLRTLTPDPVPESN